MAWVETPDGVTRLRGHLKTHSKGVHDVEEKQAVPAGVPAADRRVGEGGLVLGAPVYIWLHDRAPWMFPFLRDLKERQDRELIKQLKDE